MNVEWNRSVNGSNKHNARMDGVTIISGNVNPTTSAVGSKSNNDRTNQDSKLIAGADRNRATILPQVPLPIVIRRAARNCV